MTAPPPGWYPTPEPATDPYPYRWWDGDRWATAPTVATPQYAAPTAVRTAVVSRRASYLPSATCAVGGLLLFVGSLLPWISVSSSYLSFSRAGIHFSNDGVMVLVLGLVAVGAGVVFLLGPTGRWLGFGVAVFTGGVSLAAGVYDLHLVDQRVAGVDALGFAALHAAVGVGIVLVIVGAVIVLVAALIALTQEVLAQRRGPHLPPG